MENNELVASASMNSVRVEAAAAQLKDGKLLVTGNGATRGLEVERRTRNWAIRVQFPPGAK